MAKEFWIRKGNNGFIYENEQDEKDLGYGDQFYDAILEEPAKNSVHVIEYSAYEELLQKLKQI